MWSISVRWFFTIITACTLSRPRSTIAASRSMVRSTFVTVFVWLLSSATATPFNTSWSRTTPRTAILKYKKRISTFSETFTIFKIFIFHQLCGCLQTFLNVADSTVATISTFVYVFCFVEYHNFNNILTLILFHGPFLFDSQTVHTIYWRIFSKCYKTNKKRCCKFTI